MTMREKMARAIFAKRNELTGPISIPAGITILDVAFADAALDALMEPTPDMTAEGYSAAYAADDGCDEVAEVVVECSWRAMIRAAKEGK